MKLIICGIIGLGSVAAFAAMPELHSSMVAVVAVGVLFVGSFAVALSK